MDMRSCGATRHTILACLGALCLLAQTAVADYTPFTISTLGTVSDYYIPNGENDPYEDVIMAGSGSGYPLQYIAVGFTFLLEIPDEPTVQGAIVDSLTVPFFVDVTAGSLLPMSFRIVRDSDPDSVAWGTPNHASVVATFAAPASWPVEADADGSETSLTTLTRSSSGTLIHESQYWLVMQQLAGGTNVDVNFAYWHRDLVPAGDVFLYTDLIGNVITGTGSGVAAPAYSMTFTPVPEPSAGALLALAGAAGLWRRRRRA